MWIALAVGLLIFMFLIAGSIISANIATFNQAEAIKEVAGVAQTNADGWRAAQTLNVFLVLLLIAAVAVIVWLVLRERKRNQQFEQMLASAQQPRPLPGRWAPGPNARWGQLPGSQQNGLPAGPDMLQAILAMQLMQQMQQLSLPAPQQNQQQGNPADNLGGWNG